MMINDVQALEQYGWTNDPSHIRRIQTFVTAAVEDWWSIEPTYTHESVGTAARLERENFTLQVLMRDDAKKNYRYEATIHGWGPDGMALDLPAAYDLDAIHAGARKCGECGAEDVDTERVGFANRSCAECAPTLRAKIEKPGWCD